jgi:hypothetical protein
MERRTVVVAHFQQVVAHCRLNTCTCTCMHRCAQVRTDYPETQILLSFEYVAVMSVLGPELCVVSIDTRGSAASI